MWPASEQGRTDSTQDERPCHCERDLSDRQRHAAGGDGNKRRAEQAGAGVVGPNAGTCRHEERQGVNRQREDQPAEQAEANVLRRSPRASMVVARCAQMSRSRLPPPPRRTLACRSETRRSCGDTTSPCCCGNGSSALTRRRISRRRCRAASPCRRDCPGFPSPGNA